MAIVITKEGILKYLQSRPAFFVAILCLYYPLNKGHLNIISSKLFGPCNYCKKGALCGHEYECEENKEMELEREYDAVSEDTWRKEHEHSYGEYMERELSLEGLGKAIDKNKNIVWDWNGDWHQEMGLKKEKSVKAEHINRQKIAISSRFKTEYKLADLADLLKGRAGIEELDAALYNKFIAPALDNKNVSYFLKRATGEDISAGGEALSYYYHGLYEKENKNF